jgi:6-pyruvoyltetrahydropterin/6-carboxytetrahydropterin synthase
MIPAHATNAVGSDERFVVRLRKAVHVFCAGHFITLTDDLCEAVHGHNWLVGVDVAGPPDAHGMVVDFILLRDLLSEIVARLDHRMLLPTHNPLLPVSTEPGPSGRPETTVRFRDRRWVFPADECLLLPVANTTAEWIARWIGGELLAGLAAAGHPIPGILRVEVDECLGQSAVWERSGG